MYTVQGYQYFYLQVIILRLDNSVMLSEAITSDQILETMKIRCFTKVSPKAICKQFEIIFGDRVADFSSR